jgi:hypothetical protein
MSNQNTNNKKNKEKDESMFMLSWQSTPHKKTVYTATQLDDHRSTKNSREYLNPNSSRYEKPTDVIQIPDSLAKRLRKSQQQHE